jgi:hypothetical protein
MPVEINVFYLAFPGIMLRVNVIIIISCIYTRILVNLMQARYVFSKIIHRFHCFYFHSRNIVFYLSSFVLYDVRSLKMVGIELQEFVKKT